MTTLEDWAYVIMQIEFQRLINCFGATQAWNNSIVNKKGGYLRNPTTE
jgi:hypothetical protein